MITTKIAEAAIKPLTFPRLMKHTSKGYVVLFSADCVGTVIDATEALLIYPVGYYSNGWGMHHFSPFTGSVTLSS